MCGCVKSIAQQIIDFHGKLFLKNFRKRCKKTNIKLPWLITTSCLISESLYSAANLNLSANGLNSWLKILVSGQGFESEFQEYSINPD